MARIAREHCPRADAFDAFRQLPHIRPALDNKLRERAQVMNTWRVGAGDRKERFEKLFRRLLTVESSDVRESLAH